MSGATDPERGERAIDETEAARVRQIFADYVAGRSPRAIACDLNRQNIPDSSGGKWTASLTLGNAARETGILRNRLYVGELAGTGSTFLGSDNKQTLLMAHPAPSLGSRAGSGAATQSTWTSGRRRRQVVARRSQVLDGTAQRQPTTAAPVQPQPGGLHGRSDPCGHWPASCGAAPATAP